jgi:Ca2+-binding RTX toxin-like protein
VFRDRRFAGQRTSQEHGMFWKADASAAPGWASDVIGMLSGGDFRVLVGGPVPERLEGGDSVDVLIGLAGADALDGGANGDILLGGRGADSLMGGAGRDALSGGRGADLFRFAPADAAQAEPDIVVDFSQADGDRIDLSAFGDVAPWTPGEQGFVFAGDVTGVVRPAIYVPGEVTFVQDGDSTLVTANVADGVLRILLAGRIDLVGDDFLF